MCSLAVRGLAARYPVNRIFCVGRNYHAHAVEMGGRWTRPMPGPSISPELPRQLVESGATVPYPTGTAQLPLRDGAGRGHRRSRIPRR
ncbi:MAG: hypothetical protein MZV65_48795 [Chromatiales bacterium]|nr:hypothetical protein [Chromatiales bacterium]